MNRLILVILLVVVGFSCSDDDQKIVDNQIGFWNALRIRQKSIDMEIISIDTTFIDIVLNSDGTGIYDSDTVTEWKVLSDEYENSKKFIFISRESGTIMACIEIDESNYQEWSIRASNTNTGVLEEWETRWELEK